MKNKFFAFALLLTTVAVMSSCASSRGKYGCPTVYQYKAQKHI